MNIKKRYKIELPSLMTLGFILSIGLIIGYLGPFGSFEIPLLKRLLYWVISIFVGFFIYYHTIKFSEWYFADKNIHSVLKFIIPSVSAAFLLSFCILYMTYLFFDFSFDYLQGFIYLFPQVMIVGLIISFISKQFYKSIDKPNNIDNSLTAKPGKAFIDRIPHQLGDELLCFVMEDHYLKVYTTKGEHMILMRMKDALNELKDYDGLQVHRSWWVAKDAVSRVKKQTRNLILELENGMEVPVSKTYAAKVKEAKLF